MIPVAYQTQKVMRFGIDAIQLLLEQTLSVIPPLLPPAPFPLPAKLLLPRRVEFLLLCLNIDVNTQLQSPGRPGQVKKQNPAASL